ncbi:glycosyltransferase family 4 protein [Algibacter sp. 2305UL17-15]|uniref:glycosyltransferase family 4 protein n=1 Tax=Algibacter sp. 2305UL17-15 TaxID=3231268 RepID=UPI00345A02A4
MRVLQLIDSLEAGGAERVAVNLANGLSKMVGVSFLCATRKEGILKHGISKDVGYLFLNKKKAIDFKAVKRLNHFIINQKIDIIHAHSSSFFLATQVKIVNRKVKIVWHDHFGNRENSSIFNKSILKVCSYFFSQIITVNNRLKDWSKKKLNCKSVHVLSNFVVESNEIKSTELHGTTLKRIVCLANLRSDKDHINLLKAFCIVNKVKPYWTLHLIGKDFQDDYSKKVRNKIVSLNLSNSVFIYGSCQDTMSILSQCDIGVLSSKSEGLPMSLLEYGLAKLPVVVTNVGDCNLVVVNDDVGRLIDSNNEKELSKAILELTEDAVLRKQLGMSLFYHIKENFGKKQAIENLIKIYQNV